MKNKREYKNKRKSVFELYIYQFTSLFYIFTIKNIKKKKRKNIFISTTENYEKYICINEIQSLFVHLYLFIFTSCIYFI